MRHLASAALALTAVISPLTAQTHTDFSGKWALDPKSVEASMGPVSMTMAVTQNDKTITVETTASSAQMGDQKNTTVLNLDGSPSKNTVNTPGGSIELTSTGNWDGPAFVVMTKGDVQGQAITQTERWSMDGDGKTLHLQRDVSAMGQSMTFKLAFNKQ